MRSLILWLVLLLGCAGQVATNTSPPPDASVLEVGMRKDGSESLDITDVDLSLPTDVPNYETEADATPVSVFIEQREEDLPQSAILVPGKAPHSINRYVIRKEGSRRVWLRQVRVWLRGEGASYEMVSIFSGGRMRGEVRVPAGIEPSVDVALTEPLEVLEKRTPFEIAVRMTPVVPCSTSPCHLPGVPHSGLPVAATIADRVTSGFWDSRYADALNVEVVTEDGERIILPQLLIQRGVGFVVHKTRPTVTVLPLSTTILMPGIEQDIFKFQVLADVAGPVGWVRSGFALSSNRIFGDTSPLSGFRVLRGTEELPLAEYQIVDEDGRSMREGAGLDAMRDRWGVFLNLTHEQTSGTTPPPAVFTLRARVSSGVRVGDAITVGFWRDAAPPGCYYLTEDSVRSSSPPHVIGPHLDIGIVDATSPTGLAPGGSDQPLDFGWTDRSELPHIFAPGRRGGSRDFAPGFAVQGLNSSVRLTR